MEENNLGNEQVGRLDRRCDAVMHHSRLKLLYTSEAAQEQIDLRAWSQRNAQLIEDVITVGEGFDAGYECK